VADPFLCRPGFRIKKSEVAVEIFLSDQQPCIVFDADHDAIMFYKNIAYFYGLVIFAVDCCVMAILLVPIIPEA
jgi:hypothetical protein